MQSKAAPIAVKQYPHHQHNALPPSRFTWRAGRLWTVRCWLPLCLLLSLLSFQPLCAQVPGSPRAFTPEKIAKISFILDRIALQQVRPGTDPVFLPGSYPSYIHHRRHFKKKKKDITIFYNILIDITLKGLRPELPPDLQVKIDTLLQRSQVIYPRFYNQDRGTYNFWLRDSAYRFPYSWWIPLIKKDGAVPDDMDDTVLARLVDPKGNKDSLEKLHALLQDYIHQPKAKLPSSPKGYRHFNTYSTWFGQKFPVVLDAVVLSNILSFVCHYDLQWTSADSAALGYIVHTIKTKNYINAPLAISPYYGKTSILLYHYSRLMQQKRLPALDSLRTVLIQTSRKLLKTKGTDLMEKVITANAVLKLGEMPPELPLPDRQDWQKQVEHSDFAYFIGNIPSYMSRTFQSILIPINALMYYHYCPAFNDALVLQYLVNSSR